MSPVNILVVDDKEENIIALEALIKRDDIRIFSTTSPNEALKIAWDNSISIALIDVQMPEMDGFELASMLKSNPRTKDILIIFVTAISKETKYAVKGFDAGAVDYLYKPLDPYITSAKVDAFIRLSRSQIEIREKNQELENYALIVKNAADIICTLDAKTLRILSINQAVEKILHYNHDDLHRKSIINLAVAEDQLAFKAKLEELIADNLSFIVFEFRLEAFDKQQIWVECRASSRNGVVFLNIRDISANKSYLAELIKSKELAEYGKRVKETFLANMSHELRTPINGIIGLTGLLKDTELDNQQQYMINLLNTSSQSLLGVVNDILDISKIEAGKFSILRTNINLYDVVNAVHGLLKFKADEKNLELILKIGDNVPKGILADSLRINQILMNLLTNAIKFTERGYVKLSVTVEKELEDKVMLKFSVEDTGIGIPAHRLNKIFDSFEQAEADTTSKYGGTGLGLTIVKNLIELKGGKLTVSSQIGTGSIFSFTNWFTLTDVPQKNINKTQVKFLPHFNNVKVLVAEDNIVNQFLIAKVLKEWNVATVVVDSGKKVIEMLKLHDFDLILMDTHMPEMDGYHATKIIRLEFDEPKRSIPIISLSASSTAYEQQQAIAIGMNDVLSKPFQPQVLHQKIEALLKTEVLKN